MKRMQRIILALGLVVFSTTALAAVDKVEAPASGGTDIRFGWSVADAGDVNGDGVDDMIVGAPFDNTLGAAAGRAFVWLGGLGTLAAGPDVILDDGSSGDWFGFSVAGIGDIDGDGFDDIAVGAPGDDPTGDKSGAIYIYFGASNFIGSLEGVVAGEQGGDRFGWSIARAGDMNRDGDDDFVVGAPYSDATGTDRGRAYLFYGGGASAPTAASVIWDGPASGGPIATADFSEFAPDGLTIAGPGFGWSLTDVPDFRGDGRACVAVGAPGTTGSQGQVQLFFASSFAGTDPSSSPAVTITNPTSDQQLGWALSQAGLIDGDTRTDLLVGAPGANGDRGFVNVYYGASSPAANISTANLVRSGVQSGDRFGAAVADAGNFDGNSGDWFVGAPERDVDGIEAGWVYRFDRTALSPVDVRAENRFGSGVAGDRWGSALSGIGDLDGDGRNDVLVGSPYGNVASNAVRGIVALVSSGPGVLASPIVRLDRAEWSSGAWDLEFNALALRDAPEVTIRRLDTVRTVLASRDRGIETTSTGILARVELSSADTQLELAWVDALGRSASIVFESPSRPRTALELWPARPNPFNPSTMIRFSVPGSGAWSLRVFDLRGRALRTLGQGLDDPGDHELRFDGRDGRGRALASGAYLVVLESEGHHRAQRILLAQ